MIKAIPNSIRDECVVVKCNRRSVIARYGDRLRFPAIVAISVEVHIADLVCTRPINVKCICWATLKCSWTWIIKSRNIYLIPISISKCKADPITCIPTWRTACSYCHRVRTAACSILQCSVDLEGSEGLWLCNLWLGLWRCEYNSQIQPKSHQCFAVDHFFSD